MGFEGKGRAGARARAGQGRAGRGAHGHPPRCPPTHHPPELLQDPALERRFQQVYVDQPSVEDTISILRGLRERYELHHGVRISDSALVDAAVMSDRYIADRFLPDKAIDLVDEAAAKLKMEMTSKPVALDEIDRKARLDAVGGRLGGGAVGKSGPWRCTTPNSPSPRPLPSETLPL